MAYFNQLQGYMSNLQEGVNHENDVKQSQVAQKVQGIQQKFEAVSQQAEGWGGAISQAGIVWKHGRKVVERLGKAAQDAKKAAQGASGDGTTPPTTTTPTTTTTPATGAPDAAGGATPADIQAAQDAAAAAAQGGGGGAASAAAGAGAAPAPPAAPTPTPTPTPTPAPAPDPAAAGAGAGDAGGGGGGSIAQGLNDARLAAGGTIRVAGQPVTSMASGVSTTGSGAVQLPTIGAPPAPLAPDAVVATQQNIAAAGAGAGGGAGGGAAGGGAATAGTDAATDAAAQAAAAAAAAANAGGSVVNTVASGVNTIAAGVNTAAQTATDAAAAAASAASSAGGAAAGAATGVMGAVNLTLDSIPIIGEVVGIGTLIGGLIHGLHKKGLDNKDAQAAPTGSIATTGIDTSVFRGNTLGQSGGGTVV